MSIPGLPRPGPIPEKAPAPNPEAAQLQARTKKTMLRPALPPDSRDGGVRMTLPERKARPVRSALRDPEPTPKTPAANLSGTPDETKPRK